MSEQSRQAKIEKARTLRAVHDIGVRTHNLSQSARAHYVQLGLEALRLEQEIVREQLQEEMARAASQTPKPADIGGDQKSKARSATRSISQTKAAKERS